MAVGGDGRYTVVVSTSSQRPANPAPNAVYRQMLADPSFTEATARVGEPSRERAVMGDYYPSGEYVANAAAFETRGCPAVG